MTRLIAVLAALSLAAAVASSARAANAPDPRLDAVASEIAGSPVDVWCETDAAEWAQVARDNHPGGLYDAQGNPAPPERLRGFVVYGQPRVWLSPAVCLELRWDLHDPDPRLPTLNPGTALMTLLHESQHAKGVRGETDANCAAFLLVPHYTATLLGIPETITTAHTVTRIKRVRVHGRWVKRRVRVVVRTVGPNPTYTAALGEARANATDCP